MSADLFDYASLITCPDPMIGARQLNELRLVDRRSEMTAGFNPDGAVAGAMKHERRRSNARQDASHIHVSHGFEHALDRAGT